MITSIKCNYSFFSLSDALTDHFLLKLFLTPLPNMIYIWQFSEMCIIYYTQSRWTQWHTAVITALHMLRHCGIWSEVCGKPRVYISIQASLGCTRMPWRREEFREGGGKGGRKREGGREGRMLLSIPEHSYNYIKVKPILHRKDQESDQSLSWTTQSLDTRPTQHTQNTVPLHHQH